MKVLVTGARGFVGKCLCQLLREKGHYVREFHGDIRSFEECKKNLKGMQAVYHLAAVLEEENRKELFEVNVKGTENLIEAASKENIEHFIHASTVGVMGGFSGTGTEETPLNPQTEYEKTKADAEKIVWEAQEMLPITIIRPALIVGASSFFRKIIALVQKDFPLIGNGKNLFQTVFVKDVADAMVFVLGKKECIGEIFIVAEENPKTTEEFFSILRKELGKKGKTKKIPKTVGMVVSAIVSTVSKITGKKTILSPTHVERFTKNREYSIEKIKSIGWKPKHSTEQAIKETVKELFAEKFVG